MDLLSDETSGTRILTARHILNDDKSLPESNNAINTSFLCHMYSLQPDFPTYLAALHSYAWVVWSCGFLLLLAICLLFVVTVKSVFRHRKNYSTNAIYVLAVYPIVAGAALLGIIVPRTRILAEAIAQESVMIAMYHFFCIMIAECGGSDQLVSRAAGSRLETRVLPCCCWPCCIIPRPQIQKRNLKRLRYLVLQMPVIQTLIYVIILSLMSEDISVYLGSFMYIQPLVAASILTGVWGVIISVRAAEANGASPRPRFLALQLVLLIVKLQCALAKLLPELVTIPCVVPLNPSVFLNLIHNCVMIFEMFLLSVWAWRLYREPPGKMLEKAQTVVVAVLEDSPCVIDFKTSKDGVFNTGFDAQANNRL